MPRQPRIEIKGGLYHVIIRGNDRKDIFHDQQDIDKFLSLLKTQKESFLNLVKRSLDAYRL